MRARPRFLTVIGWLQLGGAGLFVLGGLMLARRPGGGGPFHFEGAGWQWSLAVRVAGLAVSVAVGTGVLRGWNWSRFLYGGWHLIGTAGLIWLDMQGELARFAAVVGKAPALVMLALLFTPAANRWFRPGPAEKDVGEIFR